MELYDYFQSYEDYFWHWEDNGDVLAIPKGSTIAYRDYMLTVLKHLSGQGIPPFGSLLLGIIATNPGAEKSLDLAFSIVKDVVSGVHHHDDVHNNIANANAFLNVLVSLPKSYKEGNKRIQLFQAVFVDCHRIVSRKKTRGILETMNAEGLDIREFTYKKALYILKLKNEFKMLGLLKNKFPDADSIIEKIAALPEIEEEIIPEETGEDQGKTNKEFLEELAENHKTYQIGTLIKHIWSGLNIPLHNTLPSLQPLGGVSGLSNKGSFDKLLISEFANDDLVFLSRIANNEALYINREIPPENNNLERIILVDVSIKNWGTPRLIAFAIAIAIANHPKTDIKCKAFFVGDIYGTLQFSNINDVIDNLQILQASLDSSAGLELFFKAYPHKANTEIIFISSPETMKIQSLQKTISDHHARFKYWIYTDAEGNIAVYRNQQNSKKLLQEIKLPLTKLWQRNETEQKAGEKAEEFYEEKYPILFPNALNYKVVLPAPDGEIFKITAERNILRLYDKNAGAYHKGLQMVLENIHAARDIFEIGQNEEEQYILLCFSRQSRELTVLNLSTKKQQSIIFGEWVNNQRYKSFIFFEDAFYHIGFDKTYEIRFQNRLEFSVINHVLDHIKEVNGKRLREITEAESKAYYTGGFIKNINNIFINNANNLVFNIHELAINQAEQLKLKRTNALNEVVFATAGEAQNIFVFPDGSNITVHRSGMLILKSSNINIPKIYIPSCLNIALGMATKDHFAGNSYFYLPKANTSEHLYTVQLKNSGHQKLNVIKQIKELTSYSLRELNVLVSANKGVIKKDISIAEASNIKNTLQEIGAEVDIEQSGIGEANQEIKVKQFYKIYIEAFIENIRAHGIKN
jgi:ribosomal protein L7/L12